MPDMLKRIFRKKKKVAETDGNLVDNDAGSVAVEPSGDMEKEYIEVIPLGGQSEIGRMNSIAFIDGHDAVLVDYGLGVEAPSGEEFENDNQLTTLEGRQCADTSRLEGKNIRMVCITHVHTDHVGGLPVLYKQYPDIVVMTDKLNVGMIQEIFSAERINNLPRFTCDNIERVGNFRITKFPVNHSIEGACGFKIEVLRNEEVVWSAVHPGDFKTWIPHIDKKTGVVRNKNNEFFGALVRDRPLDVLFLDSTNAEKSEKSGALNISENRVAREIGAIFDCEPGRVFVTYLAPNTTRGEEITKQANLRGRKVYVVGSAGGFLHSRGVAGWHELIVKKCKDENEKEKFYLSPPPEGLKAKHQNDPDTPPWPDNAVIICSGALAEPDSFLCRLADGEIALPYREGDVLIDSQSIIRKPMTLKRFGCMVEKWSDRFDRMYFAEPMPQLPQVMMYEGKILRSKFLHSPGHAAEEGKRTVFKELAHKGSADDGTEILIKPRRTIPVHGGEEIRKVCAALVQEWGGEAILLNDGEGYRVYLPSP